MQSMTLSLTVRNYFSNFFVFFLHFLYILPYCFHCLVPLFLLLFFIRSFFSQFSHFFISLNPSSALFLHSSLPALRRKGRRVCGAQSVNYWSFNERNCTPSRGVPSPFLAVYPHVANWYRAPIPRCYIDRRSQGYTWERTTRRINFSNARCASATALLVARLLDEKERYVSLFLINNRRGVSTRWKISSALLTNAAAAFPGRFWPARLTTH